VGLFLLRYHGFLVIASYFFPLPRAESQGW
jgi:hypothetical protein